MDIKTLAMFKITFLSILFEALPFILLGSFISSLINEFITEEHIQKFIPKNRFLAVVGASLAGLVFPVCECAIVPIVRRLLKKGMPIYVAIPFMVSVPIMNPVVLFSTYIAFHSMTKIVVFRALMGLIVAWLLGGILSFSKINTSDVMLENLMANTCSCGCGCTHLDAHSKDPLEASRKRLGYKFSKIYVLVRHKTPNVRIRRKIRINPGFPWGSIILHTSSEFFAVGKLLIFGAILSAMFKSLVPYSWIVGMGKHTILAILTMMIVAFILSLCSEADAFIARTFMGIFPSSAVMSFLVLGPMIDIKNYIMLSGTFKKKFVFRLVLLIFILVFMISFLSGLFLTN